MREMKRIVFKIDKGLSDALDTEALKQHRSRSNLLETMIIRLIAEQEYIEKLVRESRNGLEEDEEDDA